jgi:CoA:oxalate CoA-transferase
MCANRAPSSGGASFNRNKRSLILGLKIKEGKGILRRLLADADVLVENFRPGVLDRLGFSRDAQREINPRLVVGSVNGYGSTGA